MGIICYLYYKIEGHFRQGFRHTKNVLINSVCSRYCTRIEETAINSQEAIHAIS